MANPRKFSEKIALHNQKQAEETAAFEQIMKEVIGATRGAYDNKHQLHINQSLGSYRGGSLPNVNQIGNNNSIDLQSALTNLEDMKQGRETTSDRLHRERGRHSTPHQSRRFAFENKRIDVSPYNTAYLSPPPDGSWRRTNSDSALHQSALNPEENYHGANSSPSRIIDGEDIILQQNDQGRNYWDPKKQHLIPLQQSRPKSCEVPGINIYPSQEEAGAVHVPISSNTGSLPDLTNLHFPPPLMTPLDAEDQAAPINSYNQQQTSPLDTSSLSPTSLQQHHAHGLSPSASGGTLITNTNVGGGGGSRHSSPGPSPSPSSRRRHHLTNIVIGSGSPRHHGHQHSTQQQQQQVRFRPVVRHDHSSWITMEGLTMDTNALSLETYHLQQQPQFGVYPQQHQQQQQHGKSSPNFVYEQGNPTSPPMPQLSMGTYRSNSPADHSCSAPTSPVSQNLSPASSPGLGPNTASNKAIYSDNNFYVQNQQQANAIQHQLEQFKMIADASNLCTNTSNDGSHNNVAMFLATLDSGGGCGPPGDGTDGLNFSSSSVSGINASQNLENSLYYTISSDPQLQPSTFFTKSNIISSSQTAPQTSQTPTSIPDIILTGADEPIMRQDFAKDLGCAISSICGPFDSDFFSPDEALRVGLGPIDFEGLQILTDPDMPVISDPAVEETFQPERS